MGKAHLDHLAKARLLHRESKIFSFSATLNFMNVTLLACYEQGHQPLSLAAPLAALKQAGFIASAFDLSIQRFPSQELANSSLVAISTPMHTALRLAIPVAKRVRMLNPEAHICFYGLYAWLNDSSLLSELSDTEFPIADSLIGGEYEVPLVNLARSLALGRLPEDLSGIKTNSASTGEPYLKRIAFPLPDRSTLPQLTKYAHLASNGHRLAAGYVESSRGCLHLCRHCPVVPVYGGRFFVVPAKTVLGDVRQQVRSGARHITFGDPDFLNGPGHALKIARAMHDEFPDLTFDFTTKVEHIIERRSVIPELKALGAAFVVSAFESTSDPVLARLQKGHRLADMHAALEILEEAELPLQATWVPFTPWTTLDDYLHMLDWIRERRLIHHVAPVQLSIRLLVPPGSALLEHEDLDKWLGPLDERGLSYRWSHSDLRMDRLHQAVSAIVEQNDAQDPMHIFTEIEHLANEVAGKAPPSSISEMISAAVAPPRLTEDWFC